MKYFEKKLILASNSPRRREILARYGYEFEIVKSFYREEKFETFSYENIKKNSLGKALDVAQRIQHEAIVVGADTMVILDSVCLLNKPRDFSEAFSMLKSLSGKEHKVVTSISLVNSITLENLTEFTTTNVYFRNLNDDEIIEYIKTKNPLDKAGSYGIQDFISEQEVLNPPKNSFIEKIEGDYLNVVGFSIKTFENMLKALH